MAAAHPGSGRLRPRRWGIALSLLAGAPAALACSNADPTAAEDGGAGITVSAASSLRGAFTELGRDLEGADGVEVTFSFDSSSSLATQILEGAPTDVYASASPEDMTRLGDAGLVGSPQVFARNALTMVTRAGNTRRIASLADLPDAGVIALCGRDVPCGRYAQEALEDAGVTIPESSVTRGQNAAATLTAVTEGDAVAAVVYASDAVSAGDAVDAVPISAGADLTATYVIGQLDRTPNPGASAAFVELVLSEAGQAVLEEHGFLPAG